MDRSGGAIGLLCSERLRESSERSFSAGSVLTKLGSAGTCACWLELLSVLSLIVAFPTVLGIG